MKELPTLTFFAELMPRFTNLWIAFLTPALLLSTALFEETYDSIDDAQHRLANLHFAAPDGPWVDEYRLGMRAGFRVGTVTYFLETDAIIFWDEVQRLAKDLANTTPGAELPAIVDAPANNSLQLRVTR